MSIPLGTILKNSIKEKQQNSQYKKCKITEILNIPLYLQKWQIKQSKYEDNPIHKFAKIYVIINNQKKCFQTNSKYLINDLNAIDQYKVENNISDTETFYGKIIAESFRDKKRYLFRNVD